MISVNAISHNQCQSRPISSGVWSLERFVSLFSRICKNTKQYQSTRSSTSSCRTWLAYARKFHGLPTMYGSRILQSLLLFLQAPLWLSSCILYFSWKQFRYWYWIKESFESSKNRQPGKKMRCTNSKEWNVFPKSGWCEQWLHDGTKRLAPFILAMPDLTAKKV